MRKLNVLIAGSTGYIGVQLIKLLLNHRYIKIKYLCGNSSVGKKISSFDKSLKAKNLPKIIRFNKKFLKDVDIIFTALPNGEAQNISKLLLNHRYIKIKYLCGNSSVGKNISSFDKSVKAKNLPKIIRFNNTFYY